MRALLLASLSLLLLLALPVQANACVVGDSTPGTPEAPGPHGEVGLALGGAYAFKDHAPQRITIGGETTTLAEDVGNWAYAEDNDIAGLQRADWWVDDTCGGAVPGDLWLW